MKWRSLDEAAETEDPRPLREKFGECKALIAKYVPSEIQAIHARVGNHAYHEKLVISWRRAVANPMAEGALIAEELSRIGTAEDRDLL